MMQRSMVAAAALICAAAGWGRPVAGQSADLVPPRLLNAQELADTLESRYPRRTRLLGIGGVARYRIHINTDGRVDTLRLIASTGLPGLDFAADQAIRRARFSPALRGGIAVGLWSEMPLRFSAVPVDSAPTPEQLVPSNRDVARAAAQSLYPADLRELRVGGSVGVSILVDSAGSVVDAYIVETSCFRSADMAALASVRLLAFSPDAKAVRRSLATVGFGSESSWMRLLGDAAATQGGVPPGGSEGGPTRRPQILNRAEVSRSMEANYPRAERENGIGGDPTVWFRVNEEGDVTFRQIASSSNECNLDVAALATAEVVRFSPALNNGVPLEVWVELPFSFRSRR